MGIRLEKVGRIVVFDEVTKMPDERENYEGIVRRGLKEEWCGYIRHFRLTFRGYGSVSEPHILLLSDPKGKVLRTAEFENPPNNKKLWRPSYDSYDTLIPSTISLGLSNQYALYPSDNLFLSSVYNFRCTWIFKPFFVNVFLSCPSSKINL